MNGVALVAIVGMAVGTYLTRIGGYWLVGRFDLSPAVRAWLRYVPGAILAALVVPDLAHGGPAEWIAAGAVFAVAWRSENVLYAMITGIGVVVLVRSLGGAV